MSLFLVFIVSGAVTGAIYAMIASGLALTYKTSGILNFAYPAIAFDTAYVFFELNQPVSSGGRGIATPIAAVLSILVFAPLLGFVIDRLVMRHLLDASQHVQIVATIGLAIALPAIPLWLQQQAQTSFNWHLADSTIAGVASGLGPTYPEVWTLFKGVAITSDQVAVLAGAIVTAALLWYLLRHTRFGLESRATVDRPTLAGLRGISVQRISRWAWVLTAMLAGLAGVLMAPLFQLQDLNYTLIVFGSFTALVVAGMRSIPIAFAAGIGLGIVQDLINGYAPNALATVPGFESSIIFVLLLAAVMWRRAERKRSGGSAAEEAPPPVYNTSSPWRQRLPWIVATVVFTIFVEFVANPFWLGLSTEGLSLGIIFLSIVVVTGLGGMVNLATVTFVTASGFSAGWLLQHNFHTNIPLLVSHGHISFVIALIAGTLVAGVVGLLVAMPALRVGGLALALATLALAYISDQFIFELNSVNNGSAGYIIPSPSIGPIHFSNNKSLALLLIVMLFAVIWVIHNLMNSASGRAMFAVRSTDVGARSAGIVPARVKIQLFVVSAMIAGVGGVMFALTTNPIVPGSAPPFTGLVWLAVVVLFGVRRPGGAVLAGLAYLLFPALLLSIATTWTGVPWSWFPVDLKAALGSSFLPTILFGLGAINLAEEPDGMLSLVHKRRHERREKKRARGPSQTPTGAASPSERPEALDAAPGAAVPARALASVAPRAAESSADGRSPGSTAATSPPLLELRGVTGGYGVIEVLHRVDLVARAGEITAVVGPNGAGKTTLCGVAAGLVSARTGRVFLDGEDITALPADARGGRGLMLAPSDRAVFPGLTVEENLAVRLTSSAQRELAYERFPALAARRRQQAGLLSGGEQQMLALAPALIAQPRVFIADEPTLGLAPQLCEAVYETFLELRRLGVALVVVEEKPANALAVADEVVALSVGSVMWKGKPADATDTFLSELYLGGNELELPGESSGRSLTGASAPRAPGTTSGGGPLATQTEQGPEP